MATDLALLERIDRGTAFIFEEMTRRTPGGRIVRREGLLLAIGADPSLVLVNTILPVAPIQTVESLSGGPVTSWWAEADGRGVASAMATVDPSSEVAIVGWVGTDRAYRRRGIGRAVTLAATNAAFDLGARLVALQASPMGLPIYEKLGYRTVTRYQLWLPPAAADT
jgi:Acetyltransferase (GNAT) family